MVSLKNFSECSFFVALSIYNRFSAQFSYRAHDWAYNASSINAALLKGETRFLQAKGSRTGVTHICLHQTSHSTQQTRKEPCHGTALTQDEYTE